MKQNLTEGICKHIWKIVIFPEGKSRANSNTQALVNKRK